ncbi:MAG: hypothetical protein H7330_10145 [Hymenobacteraceae bacterium]|nr:hypothetical protein [Hymenobacteraceae bacterium]
MFRRGTYLRPILSSLPPHRPDSADDGPDDRYADERVNQRARPWVGYFALTLSVAYCALGVAVALVPNGRLPLPAVGRYVLAIVLVLYGGFRVRRAVNRYFR